MKDFPIIPANQQSLSQRKLVCGVGVNDADYITKISINNADVVCPVYRVWRNMISRCYSSAYQSRQPTYKGCTVCADWLKFSSFRAWMLAQDWRGNHLDKDILHQYNKIYSPESCAFVSSRVNLLLTNKMRDRGKYMLGVCAGRGGYLATCNTGCGSKYLGTFNTEAEAHKAYCQFKYKIIADVANMEPEPIRSALLKYIIPNR